MKPNSAKSSKKAILVLEDGSCFFGQGFGAVTKTSGEVVFSTSMVGYPESLTDPSYQGQILTLTYPLIGNYGVPANKKRWGLPLYFESDGIKTQGLVVYEYCKVPYHWASTKTLDKWLEDENIPAISEIDTRKLTKKLRITGTMLGILQVYEDEDDLDVEKLLKVADKIEDPNSRDLVKEVTTKKPIHYAFGGSKVFVLIDCGVKYSIIRNLINRGIDVIRVPYDFSAKEIMEYNPHGVIISNGPGNPKKCEKTIISIQDMLEENIPIMGICLGNQLLTLASGGDTYKLKYGHRSQNQPVLDLEMGKGYITMQNHGYVTNLDSLKGTDLQAWFINANDKTDEAIRHTKKTAFAVQFHPEANPGPYDTEFLFGQFIDLLGK